MEASDPAGLLAEPSGAVVQPKGRHLSALIGGKVFAYTRGADLVLKLPSARIDELESEGVGTRLVMGKRRMSEWAVVPARDPADWLRPLLAEAAAFVATSR
ncbi:MAG TPA: hypothetical protein VHJ78_10245 [Actinomycetota bacterium]|nr:hypothetical protein [Actinomycetota bacterium]